MADTAAMSLMRVMNEAIGRTRSHAMKNQVSENLAFQESVRVEVSLVLSVFALKKS